MNPTLIETLMRHAPAQTPHTRTVRICVPGRREFGYLPMGSGNGQVPGTLETAEEIERLMNERKAVTL